MQLNFKNQFTPRIIFDKNHNFKIENKNLQMPINVNFDISVSYKKNPNVDNEYMVELRLLWNDIKSPVIIDMVTCGIFSIEGNADESKIDEELKIQGAHMIFPFMRERILSITANGGIPPIIMPVIDFEKIYKQNKNKPTLQ